MSEFCKECDGWGTIEVEGPECRGSGKEECEDE